MRQPSSGGAGSRLRGASRPTAGRSRRPSRREVPAVPKHARQGPGSSSCGSAVPRARRCRRRRHHHLPATTANSSRRCSRQTLRAGWRGREGVRGGSIHSPVSICGCYELAPPDRRERGAMASRARTELWPSPSGRSRRFDSRRRARPLAGETAPVGDVALWTVIASERELLRLDADKSGGRESQAKKVPRIRSSERPRRNSCGEHLR